MGLGIQATQSAGHASSCSSLQALPFGVLNLGIHAIDTAGKKPVVSFGGRVASRTAVLVGTPRIDFKRRQVYIDVGSAKNDKGAKGKIDDFNRKLELEVSLKKARSEGPWTVHLVNDKTKQILASQTFDVSRG
jgi:hypothetical protein